MRKIVLSIMVFTASLILLAILYGALSVPCTPPSERAICKKEIGLLRGYMLADDFYGISFFSDEFSSSTNEIAFRVGEFCEGVNQIARVRMGKEVFRVVPSSEGKGLIIVDQWGSPYNFCSTVERQRNHWDALAYSEVSNIVIWSSGPNKINEHGANDDVAVDKWECKNGRWTKVGAATFDFAPKGQMDVNFLVDNQWRR